MHAPSIGRRLAVGAVLATAFYGWLAPAARAQFRDSMPSRMYYVGVEQLYRGEYRDAQRSFNRALTGAVKTLGPTGQIRWIDSICYHAMLGEVYYHAGQPAAALEQFNFACSLFLQYPRWMLRIQFDAAPTAAPALARVVIPWGLSQRQATRGKFPETMAVSQGSLDANAQLQQGGVITPPQLWPVNVVEVVRCTALAIRRRNEILGPLGPYDQISKSLASTLARGGAPPNHWSSAWVDIERGFAQAGVGDLAQAMDSLQRGTLVAGRFDHPLTGLALLEQGRLALDAGQVDDAQSLLLEASYAGFVYEDAGVIDEAFRWIASAQLATGSGAVHPSLAPAADWARRERFSHIAARLGLALAEQLMELGNWQDAGTALAAGTSQLQDARSGILGNRAAFLDAKMDYRQARSSAAQKLGAAIEAQQGMSLVNLQIELANSKFDDQTLPMRSAGAVYELLLADPTPADAILRLLESLAVMKTPHERAFERWLIATLDRGNLGAAVEVTDRAKRRRFHNALPWGGRMAAVRELMSGPLGAEDAQRQQQRSDLLERFPEFARADQAAAKIRAELAQSWLPTMDEDARRKTTRLWKEYVSALDARELRLGNVGLTPIAAEQRFPPLVTAAELQAELLPGQALLVYHDTAEGLLGFLFTSKSASNWNCGSSVRVGNLISQFLRDLGNYDANREVTAETLQSTEWQESSGELAMALLEGSSLDPASVSELIVIPDGVIWYVPFEALVAPVDGKPTPLVTLLPVRYAPTAGLAFSAPPAWRRVQRTGVVLGGMVAGKEINDRKTTAAALLEAVPAPFPLAAPQETASPAMASLLDALVVLEDLDAAGPDPLAWSPLPVDRSAQTGFLEQWLAMPGDGPQRVLLPGLRTLAERGGKASRRRGAAPAGSELFFASSSLMSAGAETMLLSRWRVGGQSTLDLVREFAQELPFTAAAEAWQRSVQLLQEAPIDPAAEMRVKSGPKPAELFGKHPFFWAGYMVVDSGWRPDAPDDGEGAPDVAGTIHAVQDGDDGAPGAAMPAAGGADAGPEEEPPVEGVPPRPTPPGAGGVDDAASDERAGEGAADSN